MEQNGQFQLLTYHSCSPSSCRLYGVSVECVNVDKNRVNFVFLGERTKGLVLWKACVDCSWGLPGSPPFSWNYQLYGWVSGFLSCGPAVSASGLNIWDMGIWQRLTNLGGFLGSGLSCQLPDCSQDSWNPAVSCNLLGSSMSESGDGWSMLLVHPNILHQSRCEISEEVWSPCEVEGQELLKLLVYQKPWVTLCDSY